jgi:signal transduction histidine kinase
MDEQVAFASGEKHGPCSRDKQRCARASSEVEEREELAHIVHDLKNPLYSILLEVDLLDGRRGFEREFALALGRIRHNVRFLDRLIYNIIDLCSLEHRSLGLDLVDSDLGSLVAEVVERVVPARERGRITLRVPSAAPVSIDKLRIERVIANLLDNALKYTPRDAEISVELWRDERLVELSVTDTGPGLSRDEMATIFEPYRRASSSRGRAGNGLGLYLSKQIVEAHGGQIGVQSVRGCGAQFYFSLPIAADP